MRFHLLFVLALIGCGVDTVAKLGDDAGPLDCASVLPESRNTNYTPADAVKSNDLNDIQDCIIGSKYGPRWHWFSPAAALWTGGVSDAVGRGNGYLEATSNSNFVLTPSLFHVGQRVLGVAAVLRGAGAGNINISFEQNNKTVGVNAINLNWVDAGVADTGVIQALGGPYVIVSGYTPLIKLNPEVTGQRIYSVGLLVDCP